ncbi:MAG TPA: hypothetical protein VEI97_03740 [bacterium]|nr:hypothetical protein [bacterium]
MKPQLPSEMLRERRKQTLVAAILTLIPLGAAWWIGTGFFMGWFSVEIAIRLLSVIKLTRLLKSPFLYLEDIRAVAIRELMAQKPTRSPLAVAEGDDGPLVVTAPSDGH